LIALALLVAATATDHLSLSAGGLNLRTELLVGGLVAVWAVARSRGAALRTLGIIEVCVLGWLGANVAASLVFAPDKKESLKFAVIIAGLVILYIGARLLLGSEEAVVWAASAWVAAGAGVGLIALACALLYTFFGIDAGLTLDRAYQDGIFTVTPKVQGTMWEPNILGSYSLTVAALGFALSMAPAFATPLRQCALMFAVACAYCGMMLSMTRTVWAIGGALLVGLWALGAWLRLADSRLLIRRWALPGAIGIALGLVVGNFFMPTLSWKSATPWNLTYGQVEQGVQSIITGHGPPADVPDGPTPVPTPVGVAAASIATPVPVSKSSTFVGKVQDAASFNESVSVTSRERIYSQAFEGWRRSPVLGWGAGAFPQLYPPPFDHSYWIANLELHTLFDTGIVGLAFLSTAGALAAWRGVRLLRGPPAAWDTTRFVVFGLEVSFVGLLIAYQVTEGSWLGFTWLLFAMLVASEGVARPVRSQPAGAADA